MAEQASNGESKKNVSRIHSEEGTRKKKKSSNKKSGGRSIEKPSWNRGQTKRLKCPIYMPRSEDNLLKGKGLELMELIGEGSYAKVYLCKKTEAQEMKGGVTAYVLALKIIDSGKTSPDYAKKFLPRELSILMKIRHPNIIKMYLLFQRKSKFYMCMRYAERGDLLEYVLSHGLITENRARFWTNQIATAVEYLHTMNVVHRDIKTENILLTECFNAKLCDFGFSRFIGHEEFSSTFCGSISYTPPEILQTKQYDAKKSDMWSFGVVIFVMLVKRLPFRETENPKQLLTEQLQKSYVMPPKVEEVLSIQSKRALKHLLEPNPKKRWGVQELLGSPWMAMDFRLTKKSSVELEALVEAAKIGEEYEEKRRLEMDQKKKKIQRLPRGQNRTAQNMGGENGKDIRSSKYVASTDDNELIKEDKNEEKTGRKGGNSSTKKLKLNSIKRKRMSLDIIDTQQSEFMKLLYNNHIAATTDHDQPATILKRTFGKTQLNKPNIKKLKTKNGLKIK